MFVNFLFPPLLSTYQMIKCYAATLLVEMEQIELTIKLLEEKPLYLAYKLVEEKKIDPWDVDVEKLLKEYLELLRQVELLDLRIPAKVVAFATFLLKKQLEILFPKPPRPKVKRKVTLQEIEQEFFQIELDELIQEVEEQNKNLKKVRKKSPKRGMKSKGTKRGKKNEPPPLHKATLEEVLSYLLELLQRLSFEETVAFSKIATKNDYVAKFWGLLNLANEGKIDLFQKTPFGEIWFRKASLK